MPVQKPVPARDANFLLRLSRRCHFHASAPETAVVRGIMFFGAVSQSVRPQPLL